MKKILIALALLIGFTSQAFATPPPSVGDTVARGAIMCDTEEQAHTIVMATQELGWEMGGLVALDDFFKRHNAVGDSLCGTGTWVGTVTAVVDAGEMIYLQQNVNVWLVTIEGFTADGSSSIKGTMLWSDEAAVRLEPIVEDRDA